MQKFSYIDLLAKHGIDGAHPGGLPLTGGLLGREAISGNTALLDIGCGTGQTAAFAAKHYGCNVIAADINTSMLMHAARRFTSMRLPIGLVYANAMKLPFPSESFDIVLSESVTIFTKIHRSLKEYFRVLKPGGILIDIELTSESPLTEAETRDVTDVLVVEKVPTQDEWCSLLNSAGFRNIQIFKGVMMPWTGYLSLQLLHDFLPYFFLMHKYRHKLGYRVYRCEVFSQIKGL